MVYPKRCKLSTVQHKQPLDCSFSRKTSGNNTKRRGIFSVSRKLSGNATNRCEIATAQSGRLCTATRLWLFVLITSDHTMVYPKQCKLTTIRYTQLRDCSFSRKTSGNKMKRRDFFPVSRKLSGNATNRCPIWQVVHSYATVRSLCGVLLRECQAAK